MHDSAQVIYYYFCVITHRMSLDKEENVLLLTIVYDVFVLNERRNNPLWCNGYSMSDCKGI